MRISEIIAALSPLATIIAAVLTYLVMSSKARTERLVAEHRHAQETERLKMELEQLRMKKDEVEYNKWQLENEKLWNKVQALELRIEKLDRQNGILKSKLIEMGSSPSDWDLEEVNG